MYNDEIEKRKCKGTFLFQVIKVRCENSRIIALFADGAVSGQNRKISYPPIQANQTKIF